MACAAGIFDAVYLVAQRVNLVVQRIAGVRVGALELTERIRIEIRTGKRTYIGGLVSSPFACSADIRVEIVAHISGKQSLSGGGCVSGAVRSAAVS